MATEVSRRCLLRSTGLFTPQKHTSSHTTPCGKRREYTPYSKVAATCATFAAPNERRRALHPLETKRRFRKRPRLRRRSQAARQKFSAIPANASRAEK